MRATEDQQTRMTETTTGPARRLPRGAEAHLPQLVTMAPAPCRMLHVSVGRGDGDRCFVRWEHIVGVLCVVETAYRKHVMEWGDSPPPGATHEEMIDRGWSSAHPHRWFPEVWPVVAGGNASDQYPLRVLHDRYNGEDLGMTTILACDWPPEEDARRVVEAARRLIRDGGEAANHATFTLSDEEAL